MDQDNERHVSDELSESAKGAKDAVNKGIDAVKTGKKAVDKGRDLYDNYRNHKNNEEAKRKGEEQNGQNNPSQKNGKGDSASNSNKNSNSHSSSSNKSNENSSSKNKSGSKSGEKGSKGGHNPLSSMMSKTPLGKAKSTIGKAIKLVKRVIKALVGIFNGLPILLLIMIICFPTLFLRALVHEVLTKAIKGFMEFKYTFFDFDDDDDLTEEERQELYEKEAEEFLGKVEDKGLWVLDQLSQGAASFFQFFDDITSDDTAVGEWFDDTANYFYSKHIDINVYQRQKDGGNLESSSLMSIMVIEELRSSYANTVNIDLNTLLNGEAQKARELVNYYCEPDMEKEQTSSYSAENMMFFLEPVYNDDTPFSIRGSSDKSGETYIPVENIPIVIRNEEHYVYLQGKTEAEGYIDKNGVQHLRDSIMYNPYGNTRSQLSVSTGSNYEMLTQAAYLIAVYSACTPYDDQSIADLITHIHDGIHDADSSKLVIYDSEFSSVYLGAIVPRLYQPYIYVDPEMGYVTGTPMEGFYKTDDGDIEILSMQPLEDKQEVYPVGWVDVDGDMVYDGESETFPIVLQTYSSANRDGKPFYEDSFTVITSDKTKFNLNYDPNRAEETATINQVQEGLGYYVAGIDSKHKEKFANYEDYAYVDYDWASDFEIQYQKQERICSKLSNGADGEDNLQDLYIYRYEFPFTRISCGGLDDGGGMDEEYLRAVPLLMADHGDSYAVSMAYFEEHTDGTREYKHFNGNTEDDTIINGYEAWAYVGNTKFTMVDTDYKGETQQQQEAWQDLIYTDITLENWGQDVVYKNNQSMFINEYGSNPYVYNAKIRYMVSVDTTVIPQYYDFINESFGYKPNEVLKREYDENGELTSSGTEVTQGELATKSLKAYMVMLGIDEEVMSINNPQIGTEPTYTYEEALAYIRGSMNADGTVPSLNQKYMVYLGLCACGRIMYQWCGDSPAGLQYISWTTTRQGANPGTTTNSEGELVGTGYIDSKYANSKSWVEKYGYEFNGLDCSGFVSWIIKTAFDMNFARFDTSSVITITPNNQSTLLTTKSVLEGNATASSRYGKTFTNDKDLKVGDIGVKRKYSLDKKTGKGTYSGHVAMFIGINADGTQNWIEMTRFDLDEDQPTSGVRIFKTSSYRVSANVVYIHLNVIPEEPVPWTEMNPAWMLIPTRSEVDYYVEKIEEEEEEGE